MSVKVPVTRQEFHDVITFYSYSKCPIAKIMYDKHWNPEPGMARMCPVMRQIARLLDIEVFASSAFCRCSKDMLSTKEKIVDNALELKIKEEETS